MLCDICLAIDFRPLNEWKHRDKDINNCLNEAFRFSEPKLFDATNIDRWREGQGNVTAFYFHHDSGTALLDSAQAGCHLCAVIAFTLFAESVILSEPIPDLQTLPKKEQPVVLSTKLPSTHSRWRDNPGNEHIQIFCGKTKAQFEVSIVQRDSALDQTCIGIHHDLELAWTNNRLEDYISTWSSLNLQLATTWLDDCMLNHGSCQVGKSLLPKRVIDIGDSISFQPVLIQPVESTYDRYIILSHCWGNGKPILPTNIRKQERIWSLPPLSEWEQTFQDTVHVARSFKIRYLWIDAPCILQGSENAQDWKVESVKMAQYFQNATICIYAGRARSGADGLFSSRNPLLTYPYHVRLPATGELPEFERFLHPSRGAPFFYTEVEPNSTDSPPNSRAWCLQEEILSPRTLTFGRKRLYWQCFSASHSESRTCSSDSNIVSFGATMQDINILKMHMRIPDYPAEWRGQRNPFHDAWYLFIRSFNLRDISYYNDVLPAISGVAELLRPHLGSDKYLAGIWQQDLVVGLLWYVTYPNLGSERLKTTVSLKNFDGSGPYAPSWSWISQAHRDLSNGRFKYLGVSNVELRARLVGHDIRLKDESLVFGLIDLGVLVFLTQLPRITVTPGLKHKSPFYDGFFTSEQSGDQPTPVTRMEMDPTEWKCQPDPLPSSKGWSQLSKYQLIGQCHLDNIEPLGPAHRRQHQKRPYVKKFVDAFVSPLRTIDAFFLPLKTDEAEYGRFRTVGLIIVKTSAPQNCGQGEYYKRIGCGKFNLGPGAWKACHLPFKEIQLV